MADIAQLVRAPDCGSGGRGFEPHYSPHLLGIIIWIIIVKIYPLISYYQAKEEFHF